MKPIQPLFVLGIIGLLAACGGSGGSDDSNASATGLTISAGANEAVDEGTVFKLNGTVAAAAGTMSVEWSQVSGPMVAFSATNSLAPEITLPRVQTTTDAVLRLTVADDTGSAADDVTLTIANTANGPDGPSPQGIRDDRRGERRNRGREPRNMVDSREVRTYGGTNNNVANPDWGSTFSHLQRLGPVDYADGISALAGALRKSAREISNEVANQAEDELLPNAFGHTDMVWQWGQFIDHDLDLTDGAEEAADIIVPEGDPEFDPASTGTQTIAFSRALFDETTGTSVANPREQENEITSWIDGSMIYGSDDERALALRVGADSPFLATSEGNLLPFNTGALPNANGFVRDPTTLFLAGDVRINEQVGLATMHTLWVREHNRIAQSLLDFNFSSDPEVIFQQARRLVIAKIQKITFEEYLPALHGPNPLPAYTGYDSSVNPSIYNEFSVAAYRFGHSLLNEQMLRLDASGNEAAQGHLALRDAFFTAPLVLVDEASIDSILRGLASQAHQRLDPLVIQDIRNFLFGVPGDGGLDLASLNIQRGRDHGVPSYNNMRAVMGLGRFTSINQITADAGIRSALSAAYDGDVDLIDLWVGGLAEDATGDSQFGPLFEAIILRQFQELRDGDRFWYERDLTSDELDDLESVTLAQVIRANTGIDAELQDDVFSLP